MLDAVSRLARPADRALEVGFGTGWYTFPLRECVGAVVAVDPSEPMRARMHEILSGMPSDGVVVRPGTLPHGLAGLGEFDGALSVGVLDYIDDLGAGLAGLAAAVRPGGWVVATFPHRCLTGRMSSVTGRALGRRVFLRSRAELLAAATDTGLELERCADVGLTRPGRTLVLAGRRRT